MANKMRIAFLLGAGTSSPAKMPSTEEITNRIVSGKNIWRSTDDKYLLRENWNPDPGSPDVILPSSLLRILLPRIKKNYSNLPNRMVSYEDLYYVVNQIHNDDTGDYENPVVMPFVKEIEPEVQALFTAEQSEWGFSHLARETVIYIEDSVCGLLQKKPSRLDHLASVVSAIRDDQIEQADVFTLNHDTVVEQIFAAAEIDYQDGFSQWELDEGVRVWTANIWEKTSAKVRLYKLHGSFNWFRFQILRNGFYQDLIGYVMRGHSFPDNLVRLNSHAEVLIGTFNKMLRYTSGIFAEIFFRFYRELRFANILVSSGYSFGDKGINNRIIEWLYEHPARRILIIDPDMERLRKRARPAISRKWGSLAANGQLIEIRKGIEQTSWEEIKSRIRM